MFETIGSRRIAGSVRRYGAFLGKIMTVLIEINRGKELNKTGVLPEDVDKLVYEIKDLPNRKN